MSRLIEIIISICCIGLAVAMFIVAVSIGAGFMRLLAGVVCAIAIFGAVIYGKPNGFKI